MKTPAAIAALVLVGACSPAEDATMDAAATETAMADDTAMAENTATPTPVDQSSSNEPAQERESPKPTSNAIKVAGKVDAIILDAEEPMIEISGQGGAKHLAVVASGQIDAIIENTQGIGSAISLECQKSDIPPEDGYTWVEECELS